MTRAKYTPEERQRVKSERMKAYWADPEWRAKRMRGVQTQHNDPEYRKALMDGYWKHVEKRNAAAREKRNDPEYVKRQREGSLAWHGEHERVCPRCGVTFTGGRFAKRCPECRKSDPAWRKRTMLILVERDGATCKLCGKPIDLTLSHKEDWSITIDHIEPVGLGGTDDLDNLQLAHRKCNSEKGLGQVSVMFRGTPPESDFDRKVERGEFGRRAR